MKTFLSVIGGIILFIPLAWAQGYVLADMWFLFVVPLGVVAISVWHAAGFSVMVSMLTYSYSEDETDASAVIRLIIGVAVTLMFWGLARLYHYFDTIGFIG
jgi:hypothetical protein